MAVRLGAVLVLGGVIVCIGQGIFEMRRTERKVRIHLTARTRQITGDILQTLGQAPLDGESIAWVRYALDLARSGSDVRCLRVRLGDGKWAELGRWLQPDDPPHVQLDYRGDLLTGDSVVSLDQMTVVHGRGPETRMGQRCEVMVLIDGPGVAAAARAEVIRKLTPFWMFLGAAILFGLLLTSLWVTGPLAEVVHLVSQNAAPESFERMAARRPGEFGHLAMAIGQMLQRLAQTTGELTRRERAFQHLYEFAPAAMIGIDVGGTITEANRRAMTLLRLSDEAGLIGHDVLDFIDASDRPLLRQTIERLDVERTVRCELRVLAERREIDVALECSAVRAEDGTLQTVRLAMLDISAAKGLQRQLAEKNRLINLVIDHMSDAILLVDDCGMIATCNQQLYRLLQRPAKTLVGERYDPATLWSDLGIEDMGRFLEVLSQIESEDGRGAEERVETQAGTFLFQGVPVHDALGEMAGRLWVVQDISSQEQSKRLVERHVQQLHALKGLTHALSEAGTVDALLERVLIQLHGILNVDAVGLAIRVDEGGRRSRQIIHRGDGAYLLAPNRDLVGAVENHLMPTIMAREQVTFWPDLPRTPWAEATSRAGLTCLAGTPLVGGSDPLGIVWIARRGGERIESHQIHLLEALAPVIAARIEVARIAEQMQQLELTDPVTDLPDQKHLAHQVSRLSRRLGATWSITMLKIDRFGRFNDWLDHEGANEVLRSVGVALKRTTRKSTFLARLPGPCFVVLSPGLTGEASVHVAERLQRVIGDMTVPIPGHGNEPLSASVAVVRSEDPGAADQWEQLLLSRMDQARATGTVIAA